MKRPRGRERLYRAGMPGIGREFSEIKAAGVVFAPQLHIFGIEYRGFSYWLESPLKRLQLRQAASYA
jgi:hypothetical protein